MKKSLFLAFAALAVAGFSSCDRSNDVTSTVSFSAQSFNLITTTDNSASPSVASSVYNFNFDQIAGTGTIATEITNSVKPISFATEAIKYTVRNYQWNDAIHEVINMETFKSKEIYNLNFHITTMANIPPVIEGLPKITIPSMYKYVVASYQVGDNVNVRTFWPDVTFTGTTTTSYSIAGANKSFNSTDVKYRVIIKPVDKKATVILYDAKFAEEMPKTITNVVLNDLPVKFTDYGYEISGTEITPVSYEGGVPTPYTNYIFNTFTLNVGADLTEANISYKVSNAFNGSFTGSYIVKPQTTPAQ